METVLSHAISLYIAIGIGFSILIAMNIESLRAKFFKREHIIIYIAFPFSMVLTGTLCITMRGTFKILDWITD